MIFERKKEKIIRWAKENGTLTGSSLFYPDEKTGDIDLMVLWDDIKSVYVGWELGQFEQYSHEYETQGKTRLLKIRYKRKNYDIIMHRDKESMEEWKFATRYFNERLAHQIPYKDKPQRIKEFQRLREIAVKLYCG